MSSSEGVSEEDAAARAEELEVLSEIYAGELDRHGASSMSIRLQDAADVPEYTDPAALRVDLPTGYPSSEPPIATIRNWPRKDQVEDLHKELLELYQAPDVVVFAWVEFLREKLNEIIDVDNAAEDVHDDENVLENDKSMKTGWSSFGQNSSEDHGFEEENYDMEAYKAYEEDKARQKRSQQREKPLTIISGDPFTQQKSSFQAHVAKVTSAQEALEVIFALKQDRKILRATHNMMAYRIERQDKPGSFICDNDDDGENAAGSKLAGLLDIVDARNVVVVVSRWYGGIQMGPSRFKVINNVARELLLQQGFISSSGSSS
mmetsp:Transcript_16302/g.31628  ORF Transcript_16302/g.31628 Transcript_16302/m.31628 type:complete len:319 (-) Transcript_16302:124-1080(-)